MGPHWIALYVNAENVTHFNSFRVEHVPKEILKIQRKQKSHKKYL